MPAKKARPSAARRTTSRVVASSLITGRSSTAKRPSGIGGKCRPGKPCAGLAKILRTAAPKGPADRAAAADRARDAARDQSKRSTLNVAGGRAEQTMWGMAGQLRQLVELLDVPLAHLHKFSGARRTVAAIADRLDPPGHPPDVNPAADATAAAMDHPATATA